MVLRRLISYYKKLRRKAGDAVELAIIVNVPEVVNVWIV
jgi:hypothetical protein